jgi:hypothetical protein
MKTIFPIIPMGVGVVVALAAWADPAFAAMEMETVDYGSATSPLAIGSSETLSLNQFDTDQGTLTGVSVELFSHDTVSSVIFSTSSQSLAYTGATATVPVTVTASDSMGALAGLTTSVTDAAGPFSGTTSGPGLNIAGSLNTPLQTATINPASFPYQGAGPGQFSFTLSVANAVGAWSGNGGTSLFFGGNGSSYGDIQLCYTYTPANTNDDTTPVVPEPGTLCAGLFMISLGGFKVVRRFCRNSLNS